MPEITSNRKNSVSYIIYAIIDELYPTKKERRHLALTCIVKDEIMTFNALFQGARYILPDLDSLSKLVGFPLDFVYETKSFNN